MGNVQKEKEKQDFHDSNLGTRNFIYAELSFALTKR